jgi:hypothetical protein
MQLIAFICKPTVSEPCHETGKGRTPVSPKLHSEKQEGRFLLLQCHTPPCSALFTAVYKRDLKEEEGLLLGFLFLL